MLSKIMKDLTKEIDKNWREKIYYDDALKMLNINIKNLEKRVKHLEQQQTYYPFSEEELLKEGVGGTD